MYRKIKVAIIGSGASGLVAIKTCLDEGINPVCFEMQDEIGGMWNYVPDKYEAGMVYKSTVINTSKEMMCFSDFPIPNNFPNYMHNTKVQEYFRMYEEKFQLRQHIQFHTKVLSCTKADGFAKNGQWKVHTKNVKTGDEKSEYYDGIMVCVGHHAIPHYPLHDFPGIEKFKGKYMHSHDYRDHKGYEDLRVVIIGIGNSGGDIAVELSRHSKQVFLSTRRGAWIIKRIFENGMPLDIIMTKKVNGDIRKILPQSVLDSLARKTVDSRLDHEKYGLMPKHEVFAQHPSVNDDIANRIITGSVQVRSNVARFTEDSAVFDDGTEEKIDAVIFATGYSMAYPFLDDSVLKVEENQCDLYEYIFPVTLEKNTLAIIGGIQPLGAVNPISELQCRWATKVIKGEVMLPSKEEMKRDIHEKREEMAKRYVKSRRHTVQVNYQEYMDELAEKISCKPKYYKYFLTDPKLAMKVYFGPAVPYIYRLEGPGKWPDAKKTIMTVQERVICPLMTRKTEPIKKSRSLGGVILSALFVVFVAWILGVI
uniref:flavin-containing monooxygenase 5-like n=1 Tax=Styela clava TaxID=7725 RepID=UPI00193A4D04|nr:flavin-containing monooxygenase 5-like [Styela clava]